MGQRQMSRLGRANMESPSSSTRSPVEATPGGSKSTSSSSRSPVEATPTLRAFLDIDNLPPLPCESGFRQQDSLTSLGGAAVATAASKATSMDPCFSFECSVDEQQSMSPAPTAERAPPAIALVEATAMRQALASLDGTPGSLAASSALVSSGPRLMAPVSSMEIPASPSSMLAAMTQDVSVPSMQPGMSFSFNEFSAPPPNRWWEEDMAMAPSSSQATPGSTRIVQNTSLESILSVITGAVEAADLSELTSGSDSEADAAAEDTLGSGATAAIVAELSRRPFGSAMPQQPRSLLRRSLSTSSSAPAAAAVASVASSGQDSESLTTIFHTISDRVTESACRSRVPTYESAVQSQTPPCSWWGGSEPVRVMRYVEEVEVPEERADSGATPSSTAAVDRFPSLTSIVSVITGAIGEVDDLPTISDSDSSVAAEDTSSRGSRFFFSARGSASSITRGRFQSVATADGAGNDGAIQQAELSPHRSTLQECLEVDDLPSLPTTAEVLPHRSTLQEFLQADDLPALPTAEVVLSHTSTLQEFLEDDDLPALPMALSAQNGARIVSAVSSLESYTMSADLSPVGQRKSTELASRCKLEERTCAPSSTSLGEDFHEGVSQVGELEQYKTGVSQVGELGQYKARIIAGSSSSSAPPREIAVASTGMFTLANVNSAQRSRALSQATNACVVSSLFAARQFSFVNCAADLLRDNFIGILSGKWFLERPDGYVLRRRQDLEPSAFLLPPLAARLYRQRYGLVVLSYPWLSKQHPDPDGFFFRIIQKYMLKHMQQFCTTIECEIGIFWDFAAFPQADKDGNKTDEEKATLKRGLVAINYLYGSPDTVVLQLKTLPETSNPNLNLRPYEERGWCVFEETISNIIKPPLRHLDLGVPLARQLLDMDNSTWWDVQRAAACSKRAPILHPDAMNIALARSTFTNGKVDRSLVEDKYREFFMNTVSICTFLHFSNFGANISDGWDDDNIKQVSRALPAFAQLIMLNLLRHPFSDRGLRSVAEALPTLMYLRSLSFCGCIGFDGSGFDALVGRQIPALEILVLNGTSISDLGIEALMSQLVEFPRLRVLHLRRCYRIGIVGYRALARQLPLGLEELHLGQSALDDAGLGMLAERLRGLSNLRKLDLQRCENLTAKGLAALVGCLPQLPTMLSVEQDFRCPVGHRLETSIVDSDDYSMCASCHEPFKFGNTVYSCPFCFLYDACTACMHGALLVPGHLSLSPEGVALRQAWKMGGRREASQLRWL